MAKPKAKVKASIGCKASNDGRVTVMLIKNGKAEAGVGMPGKDVGSLVAVFLAAAIEAAKRSGQSPRVGGNTSLTGTPMLIPTALGLSRGEPPEPMGLVIHAGMARFGIALANPRELGEALLAASAPEGSVH